MRTHAERAKIHENPANELVARPKKSGPGPVFRARFYAEYRYPMALLTLSGSGGRTREGIR